MDRQVDLKDVVELIDSKIDFLNQQNGAGMLMRMAGWFNEDRVNTVIDSNNIVINELTVLRMRVLEL